MSLKNTYFTVHTLYFCCCTDLEQSISCRLFKATLSKLLKWCFISFSSSAPWLNMMSFRFQPFDKDPSHCCICQQDTTEIDISLCINIASLPPRAPFLRTCASLTATAWSSMLFWYCKQIFAKRDAYNPHCVGNSSSDSIARDKMAREKWPQGWDGTSTWSHGVLQNDLWASEKP